MKRGSSHELAALLLTEAITYATITVGITLWVLLLDKKAAFDTVLKEHVITSAYSAADYRADQSLLYIANRLVSRRTFLQSSSSLMGPINDQVGVEQGGVSSGDLFQLVNGEELKVTNSAGLGLNMGGVSLGSIGVADDVALISPCPHALQSLLNLSQSLTTSRCMVNVPEKTKLLVYSPKGDTSASILGPTLPITMDDSPLSPSKQAEHVGVLRSTCGTNLPALTSRIAAHGKSLYAVISVGMARSHRGNPAASLRVESTYCAPKLFSGLATLNLSKQEIEILSVHRRLTLQQLQRLHPQTPAPAIHFLSGSLPAAALLHMQYFTLLHMIACLGPSNILHQHALYSLHHNIQHSWFKTVRSVSQQYSLPDPIQILLSPPPKKHYKHVVRKSVISHWHSALQTEAAGKRSLQFLRPAFLPLGSGPHPLWWTCGSSPTAVRAATVQAKMLSGRYRTCWLRRHFGFGETGACRLPGCGITPGDTAHILSGECPALLPALTATIYNIQDQFSPFPQLLVPLLSSLQGDRLQISTFILDPSTDSKVISLQQEFGQEVLRPIFRASRAWVWSVHRTRMRLLGLEEYLL